MHRFATPAPVRLRVEFGAGSVLLEAAPLEQTTVELVAHRSGDEQAQSMVEATRIEQRDDEILVEVPRRPEGFFRRTPELDLRIRLPEGSGATVRTRSADVTARGRLANTRVETGSGDVRLDVVSGEGKVRTGSGDIAVRRATGRLQLASGSGDIEMADAEGDVDAKTASGDVRLERAHRGTLRLASASGDVTVGVAAGVAAWLDVTSVTGEVRMGLDRGAEPSAGEDSVALHVRTATGDVAIRRAGLVKMGTAPHAAH